MPAVLTLPVPLGKQVRLFDSNVVPMSPGNR
jgi:hypothetical protein